jgi:flagellar motor switch protein FliN/FliY
MTALEEIAHIASVPIEIEVQLDQRWMKMSELLGLEAGSVIAMEKAAGENIDIRVGSELVGFGEIVVTEHILGVRVTDFNIER